jgi:hypothetical protein
VMVLNMCQQHVDGPVDLQFVLLVVYYGTHGGIALPATRHRSFRSNINLQHWLYVDVTSDHLVSRYLTLCNRHLQVLAGQGAVLPLI